MTLSNKLYDNWNTNGERDGMITFFTPTFNRAKFLPRVYDCMLHQTDKHFVWIIVNDGSSDNTEDVAQGLLERDEMPILFITKPNGGKHSAFKAAFERTETEYFICMDDDDIYSEKSVETFLGIWNDIKKEHYEAIGAIRTLVSKSDGTIASSMPVVADGSFTVRTTLEQNYIYHIHQENWTCYKTACLRQIELFPTGYWMCELHEFYNEALWQGRFARKYKCRYVNVVLRTYTEDAATSIMRSNKSRQHYVDMFINTKMELDEQYDYIKKDIKTLIFDVSLVSILQHKLGILFKSLLQNTPNGYLKVFYILLYPISWVSPTPKITF